MAEFYTNHRDARKGDPIKMAITAAREDGTACATELATVNDRAAWLGEPRLEVYPEAPLPR